MSLLKMRAAWRRLERHVRACTRADPYAAAGSPAPVVRACREPRHERTVQGACLSSFPRPPKGPQERCRGWVGPATKPGHHPGARARGLVLAADALAQTPADPTVPRPRGSKHVMFEASASSRAAPCQRVGGACGRSGLPLISFAVLFYLNRVRSGACICKYPYGGQACVKAPVAVILTASRSAATPRPPAVDLACKSSRRPLDELCLSPQPTVLPPQATGPTPQP